MPCAHHIDVIENPDHYGDQQKSPEILLRGTRRTSLNISGKNFQHIVDVGHPSRFWDFFCLDVGDVYKPLREIVSGFHLAWHFPPSEQHSRHKRNSDHIHHQCGNDLMHSPHYFQNGRYRNPRCAHHHGRQHYDSHMRGRPDAELSTHMRRNQSSQQILPFNSDIEDIHAKTDGCPDSYQIQRSCPIQHVNNLFQLPTLAPHVLKSRHRGIPCCQQYDRCRNCCHSQRQGRSEHFPTSPSRRKPLAQVAYDLLRIHAWSPA